MGELTMLHHPFDLADEWTIAISAGLVAFCCLLHLNAMGKPLSDRMVERFLTFFLGCGASGIAIGPFCDLLNHPTIYEMFFYVAVALYAIWLTKAHWMELPILNRRQIAYQVQVPRQKERRGMATEEADGEDIACSH